MMRAVTSVVPPVPKATTARSGLVGYCACAKSGRTSSVARRSFLISSTLADVVDAHADSLGVKCERPLPSRAGLTALVIRLYPREGLHQVGLADAAQDAGHHDVGHREIGARDPLAAVEAALDVAEPAAGELAHLRGDLASGLAAVEYLDEV